MEKKTGKIDSGQDNKNENPKTDVGAKEEKNEESTKKVNDSPQDKTNKEDKMEIDSNEAGKNKNSEKGVDIDKEKKAGNHNEDTKTTPQLSSTTETATVLKLISTYSLQ